MGKIQQLSPAVVRLIAAGEVVERPASVLKELVENSIDASATNIKVELTEGGKHSITITDNGSGMDKADAWAAFELHATSKITTAADLQNLSSLGFRGEALASIASVSSIQLDTCTNTNESTSLINELGQISEIVGQRHTPGTKITVQHLFANIPARAKFLKSTATELQQCIDAFLSLALTQLHISWELWHNDKLVHRLPAAADFISRVHDIWGKPAANLYQAQAPGQGGQLTIWIGSPDIARKDRKLQYIFINGRAVSDRLLQKAVQSGYAGFIHRDLQPVYFLFWELPGTEVDVNVHPRKLEVKFANGSGVYAQTYITVKRALEQQTKQDLTDRLGNVNTPTIDVTTLLDTPAVPYTQKLRLSDRATVPQRGFSFTSDTHTSPQAGNSLSQIQKLLSNSASSAPAPIHTANITAAISGPWQIFGTYIIYARAEDVVFVDQHAAAEKIAYEKLRQQLGKPQVQKLLIPEVIELAHDVKEIALNLAESLAQIGVEIEDFGGNSIRLIGKPAATPQLDVAAWITTQADSFQSKLATLPTDLNHADNTDLTDWETTNPVMHYLLATTACHSAIRAGQLLSNIEMQQLITDLNACQYPYNCPHGRPVSWVMSRTALEKNFQRII
jgi:DNA mismatch repair protein MutL